MANVLADLAIESEAATVACAGSHRRTTPRRPATSRRRVQAPRDGGRQVLGVQTSAPACRRGARVPRRQRLRRGIDHAAAVPREPAQRHLGRLRQCHVPRRAARHRTRTRIARGVPRRARARGSAPTIAWTTCVRSSRRSWPMSTASRVARGASSRRMALLLQASLLRAPRPGVPWRTRSAHRAWRTTAVERSAPCHAVWTSVPSSSAPVRSSTELRLSDPRHSGDGARTRLRHRRLDRHVVRAPRPRLQHCGATGHRGRGVGVSARDSTPRHRRPRLGLRRAARARPRAPSARAAPAARRRHRRSDGPRRVRDRDLGRVGRASGWRDGHVCRGCGRADRRPRPAHGDWAHRRRDRSRRASRGGRAARIAEWGSGPACRGPRRHQPHRNHRVPPRAGTSPRARPRAQGRARAPTRARLPRTRPSLLGRTRASDRPARRRGAELPASSTRSGAMRCGRSRHSGAASGPRSDG